MTDPRPRPKVAIVIGSGSVKCAAALGMQKVLQREGIDIDMVVGCSGGSIYAACIGAGFTVDETVAMTTKLWTREITAKRDRKAMLQMMMPKLFGFSENFGMKDDRLAVARLRDAFGDRRIENLPSKLFITATDFKTGELVVISSGLVVDAVRASIAIPFIFKPWPVDGRMLMDGFISDPMPVGVAMKEGADVIIAMGFESPMQESVKSPARFGFQLSSIMCNNLLKSNFAFHSMAHHSEVIAIIPRFTQRVRLFDTEKIPYIIEEGMRATEDQLPYLRRLLGTGTAEASA